MKESYLFDDREITIPGPTKIPHWRKVTEQEVTAATRTMLNKLGEFFPNVSLFSWHPNIKGAQYHTKADMWGSNYNARIRIGDSIIVKSAPGWKSHVAVTDGFRTIENALKHIPEVKTCGGSGDNDTDTKTYQMQLSFLVGDVGTHERAREIKHRVVTHGAYSLYKGEWFYIPADLFNPWIEIEQKIKKRSEEIVGIFKNHPTVIKMSDYSISAQKDESDKIYSSHISFNTPYSSLALKIFEDHYKLQLNTFTTFRSDEEKLKLDLESLLEKIGGLRSETIEQLVKNPSDYKRILHPYCGRVAARKFGF